MVEVVEDQEIMDNNEMVVLVERVNSHHQAVIVEMEL